MSSCYTVFLVIIVVHLCINQCNGYLAKHKMFYKSNALLNKSKSKMFNTKSSLWNVILSESAMLASDDIKANTFMANAVLSQHTLDDVIIDYVSNQLESTSFQATQIRNLFADVREQNANVSELWARDLIACTQRDKKLPNTVSTLLFSKGFQALVTHRIASALWYTGRDGLARYFQSMSSKVFGADIHPACRIGSGCYISGATSVVLGETGIIGDDCSISHSVTMGSTGKDKGDRHPKIGNRARIGAGAIILGNILVGEDSVVNAGSVVMKPVEARTRVGGVPAKLIERFNIP